MGEVRLVVDHMKLEYKGIFSTREMFRMFTRWFKENPFEKGADYISEQHTSHGKCIEYVYWPWYKLSDFMRKYMKIRILIYDLKKVDIVVDGRKKTMDHAKIIIYIDGFMETDYEHRWGNAPMLIFIRTLYAKFIYKRYTKFFEKVIVDDCNGLYTHFETFFNMYKSYVPVKEAPY